VICLFTNPLISVNNKPADMLTNAWSRPRIKIKRVHRALLERWFVR
jgi:hypothetical protein